MISNYPYFSFPSYYRRFYTSSAAIAPTHQIKQNRKSMYASMSQTHNMPENFSTINNSKKNNNTCKNSLNEKDEKSKSRAEEDESKEEELPLFELFGIKLYFDDILLLGLLFVLYSEGVEDTNLYIALILLLIS